MTAFRCPPELECYRMLLDGQYGDDENGAMMIKPKGLFVIFAAGEGWEHVSVSRRGRCPSWEDMQYIKRKFWPADACVIQYHVLEEEHINAHPYCLHLWRPTRQEIPRPPAWMVA